MVRVLRYHPLLVALHWLLAFLVIAALTLGALVMAKIPNSSPMKIEALRSHMTGGLIILVLMAVRLVVRTNSRKPPAATTHNAFLDHIAHASHVLLYAAVFGMAGSGLVMALQTHLPAIVFENQGHLPADFWAYPIRRVHYFFSRLLMGLIALHIAGALYHTFVLKDGLLRRMAFGRRVVVGADARAIPSATAELEAQQ